MIGGAAVVVVVVVVVVTTFFGAFGLPARSVVVVDSLISCVRCT
jgi:hypothetical protein